MILLLKPLSHMIYASECVIKSVINNKQRDTNRHVQRKIFYLTNRASA